MADSFSAAVAKWCAGVQRARLEIFHEAAKTIASDMRHPKDQGGNMAVLTGNLRNSLAASTFSMPPILFKDRKKKGAKDRQFKDNSDALNAVIDSAALDRTIWLGFQAPYAHKAEEDNAFVRLAAQSWQQIVDDSTRVVKARLGL